MRVLLVMPDYPKNFRYGPKTQIQLSPLGLEYIAAHIQDVAETRIFDNRPSNQKRLEQEIQKFKPDYVGISVNFTFQIYHANSIAKIAKDNGAVTVIGGWHPTLAPDNTLSFPWVDIVIRSEGELTFRELLQKKDPQGVAGLSYKRDGKIIHNPVRELADLSRLRLPARDYISAQERSRKYTFFGIPMEAMETSRGCPFNCKFCCIHNFYQHKYRHRSVPHIMQELHQLETMCNFIYIIDDNFMVNPQHVEQLCDEIIKQRVNLLFMTTARVDMASKHREIFEKMAKAGFISLYLGIESYSNKSLQNLNKQFDFQEIKSAVKIFHDLGFLLQGNVILGANLDDTIQDLESSLEISKSLDIDLLSFSFLIPYPGTELTAEMENQGLLLSKDWRKYNWFMPLIKYPHLTSEQLLKYLERGYTELPLFKNPLQKIMRLVRARGLSFILPRICTMTSFKSTFSGIRNIIRGS